MLQCGKRWEEIDRDVCFMKGTAQFISNHLGITFHQLVASKLTQGNSHSFFIVSYKAFPLFNLKCCSIETLKASFVSPESFFRIETVVSFHDTVSNIFRIFILHVYLFVIEEVPSVLKEWGLWCLVFDQHLVHIGMFTIVCNYALYCCHCETCGCVFTHICILLLQWSSHRHFYLPVFCFFVKQKRTKYIH